MLQTQPFVLSILSNIYYMKKGRWFVSTRDQARAELSPTPQYGLSLWIPTYWKNSTNVDFLGWKVQNYSFQTSWAIFFLKKDFQFTVEFLLEPPNIVLQINSTLLFAWSPYLCYNTVHHKNIVLSPKAWYFFVFAYLYKL